MTQWDAIVLGAGPAGIAAATRLSAGGARVMLVDENAAPGGQIWRGVETASAQRIALLGPDYLYGQRRVAALRAGTATLALDTTLWRVEADGAVWLKSPAGLARHHSPHIVLATGAMERPVPRPGWTLPGVTTIGGLQILLKKHGILPAGPLLLAGTGPLFYLYAQQCLKAGKRDIILLDTARRHGWLKAANAFPRALTGEGSRYLLKGIGLLSTLRWHRVPFFTGVSDLSIEQDPLRDGLVLHCRTGRKTRTFAAQHVGLHEGVIPEQHVARSLGCDFLWDEIACAFRPRRSTALESSVAGVFIAGDAGGIGGYRVAEAEGRLAAIAILHRLGKLAEAPMRQERQAAQRLSRSHLTSRPLLNLLYAPSHEILAPDSAALACRCEEVSCAAVRESIRLGANGPNQLKAFLRTGMGPCQGRLCATTIAHLFAAERNIPLDKAGFYHIRNPLIPVSVGELADLYRDNEAPDL
ncbi:FAD-dependent oxidoreductase [Sodalis sp. RH21]|uniref:FAD-dependent oxidoreductase n=1 Tax=unclassified Sodalis (in: enterobacteria) TaxID=2636512 RepID=UPI0039B44D7D